MKIKIEGGALNSAAKWAEKIAPSNPPIPVMSGVQLKASGDQLQVSATDGDTFGTLTVPADVETSGQIIVSARLLRDITATIPATGKVTMERGPRGLLMRCGTRWSLPEIAGTDTWSTFPGLGDLVGEVPVGTLSRAVSRVLPAVDLNATKPELGGVCCETGDILTLTATDCYRLPVAEVEWKRASPAPGAGDQQMIISASLLKTVTESVNGSEGTVAIYSDGNMVGFELPSYRVIGRLAAGSYPQCESIFTAPESNTVARVGVNVPELVLAVTQVSAGMKTALGCVRLDLSPEKIGLSLAGSGDDGDAGNDDVKPHHWWGESLSVGVTPRYLLDALACLDSPMAVMTFSGASKPFMVRPADKDGQVSADGYGHVLVARKLFDAGTVS